MMCPHCKGKTPRKSLFCGVCGKRIALRCARCDKRVPVHLAHCTRCGLALDDRVTGWQADRRTGGQEDKRTGGQEDKRTGGQEELFPSSLPPFLPSSPADRFLPPELAAKLESARTAGSMEGERRVVTMLFCDVKGSTAAAEKLDPEEWTEIINAAFERMIRPIYKYEGTVARLMGDGILAFFGAPIAHEDDPQRAVLAALDILDNFRDAAPISNLQSPISLSPRIGINTGLVVVGAVGSDLRMEYTAMGDAINLAARMEQTAQPGSVQIAEATWQQVAPLFDCEELGGIEIKGKTEPVRAWRVLGRKSDPGRLRGIEGLEAPLIGRENEWQTLAAASEKVQKGVGGIVFLVGEAGLGKSRLIRELRMQNSEWRTANGEQRTDDPIANPQSPIANLQSPIPWLETAAYSYETAQPYALFQRLVRQTAMILAGDGAEAIGAKLDGLAQTLPEESRTQSRRVLRSLFGLPSEDGPPLEGESFRGQLFVVTEQLWRCWATQPLVLVCDDIHWIDPASAALLQHLLPLTDELPILLICATRPDEGAPGWALLSKAQADFPHRTARIDVRPLSTNDSNRLVDSLLAIDNLPAAVRQRILDNADGNPFFVEEVVRTLLETGAVARRDGQVFWCLEDDDPDIRIPVSLQALITARIDRLDEGARRTLQLAALIGRSFYLRVLHAIAEGGLAVDQQVTVLQRADLIREIARIPEREFNFRHILTQEAAYRTILRKERRTFHRRVAEAIETIFPDQLSEQALTLAWHFAEAGESARAVHYYARAGHAAYRLYAIPEALTHYNRAVELAATLDLAAAGLTDDLLTVYANRGRLLELDLAFDQAVANYGEMVALGERLDDPRFCLSGWLAEATIRAIFTPVRDPAAGIRLAQNALALARQRGDALSEARALWNLMLVDSFGGTGQESIERGEAALAICNRYENDPQIAPALCELKAVILNDLYRPYLFSGQIQRALALNQEAQALLRQQGNLPMLAAALIHIAVAYFELGEFAKLHAALDEANRISRSIGNRGGEAGGGFTAAFADIEQGNVRAALAGIQQNIALALEVGQMGEDILNRAALAWLYSDLGDGAFAAAQMESALADAVEIPFIHTYFLALAAHFQIGLGNLARAEEWMAVAQTQMSISFWFFASLFVPLVSAEVELMRGQADAAIARLESLLERMAASGSRTHLYDVYLLYGQALLQTGRKDAALASLRGGLAVADELGARRVRWRLLRALAELSDDAAEADRLLVEAQAEIDWLLAEIPSEELRASFARLSARPSAPAALPQTAAGLPSA